MDPDTISIKALTALWPIVAAIAGPILAAISYAFKTLVDALKEKDKALDAARVAHGVELREVLEKGTVTLVSVQEKTTAVVLENTRTMAQFTEVIRQNRTGLGS